MNYTYNKKCNLDLLTNEIENSSIETILLYIEGSESITIIFFEQELLNFEKDALDIIVDLHDPNIQFQSEPNFNFDGSFSIQEDSFFNISNKKVRVSKSDEEIKLIINGGVIIENNGNLRALSNSNISINSN
jgi:hypothetical protein